MSTVTDLVQAIWDDVETILVLLGKCFGGHGLAGCVCQFAVRTPPPPRLAPAILPGCPPHLTPPLRTPLWQLTLQPEWRKAAKDVLKGNYSATAPAPTREKVQAAENIACLDSDPFDMIVAQIETLIIRWVETSVNEWIIRPVNHLVHNLNDDLTILDRQISEIGEGFREFGDFFSRRRLDAQEGSDMPIPDFEALTSGRRMEEGALDNFSRHVYENTTYGRGLSDWAEAGIPLRMARSGERRNGRFVTTAPPQDPLTRRRGLKYAYVHSVIDEEDVTGYHQDNNGKTPTLKIPYIQYVDNLCLDDPNDKFKPCLCDRGNPDACVDWAECEDAEKAGGLDMICCANPRSNPRNLAQRRLIRRVTSSQPAPAVPRDRLQPSPPDLHQWGARDAVQGAVFSGVRGRRGSKQALRQRVR